MSESFFPNTFSDLSLEFLNTALEKRFNSKIVSFTKGKELEAGFTGEVFRISLTFKNSNDDLPKTLIIKLQTSNPGINSFIKNIQGYEKEIKIYDILFYKN